MVSKLIEISEGGPFTKDGSYFDILESNKVVGPQGVNVGWDTFNNIEEAAAYYGVTRLPDPEPEEPEEEVNAPETIEDIILQMLSEEVNS